MENNTSGPARGAVSQNSGETCAEPYVGMPIYLDDSFFDFINEDIGIECPRSGDMGDFLDDMDDIQNMRPTRPENGGTAPETGTGGGRPGNGGTMPETGTGGGRPGNGGTMPETGTGGGRPGNGGTMPETGTGGGRPGNGGTMPGADCPDMSNQIQMDCAKGCPLAMAYVPWQVWQDTYDMEKGFMIGTIFPELDLPFLGGAAK